MKFIFLTLFAGLCLVAVSANGGASVQSGEIDFEYVPEDNADGIVDVEAFGFLGVIKAALRTVKGMNCCIKAALIMKATAQQGLDDLQACGGTVSKQVQNVINSLTAIIGVCNDIINLSENVCKADDDTANTSKSCFPKFVKKMFSLYSNIQKSISLIKKIPSATSDAGVCAKTACTNVSNTFMQFPTYITNCSKLTSN